MARHFVRLKLRLIAHRIRRSGVWSTVGLILTWLLGLGGGLLFGLLSYFGVRLFDLPLLGAIWVGLSILWVIGPIVTAGVDETVEPRRLELLPIPRRQLVTGMLAAATIGPGALATALTVFGGVFGVLRLGVGLPLQLFAGLVMVLWCLGLSRLVTSALSDLLRSRRGRELMALIGPMIALTAVLFSQFAQRIALRAQDGGGGPNLDSALAWVNFVPPGALARAVIAAGTGSTATSLGWLAYGVGATLFVLWLWDRSLERMASRVPATGGAGKSRNRRLVPGLVSWLRGRGWVGSAASATASKELLGFRRDPRLRMQLVGVLIAMIVFGFGAARALLGTEFSPLLTVMVAFLGVSITGFNLFGVDAGSMWAYVSSGASYRQVLVGKNLAVALITVPLLVLVALVGSLTGGTWATTLVALMAGLALALIWTGVGNNVSVHGAFPLPEGNVFTSPQGSAMLSSMVAMMVASALTGPAALAIGLTWFLAGPEWSLIPAVASLIYGVVIYRVGLGLAVTELEGRAMRLLEKLDR